MRWQASGDSGSPLPGTRISEAVIGSRMPCWCASVIGTRSGSVSSGGSSLESLTSPLSTVRRISSVFLLVMMVEA